MGRPGRERWLEAGQELLREGGVATVKLDNLTRATGLTTGSFYHHFAGMGDFLDALARYYGTEQIDTALRGLQGLAPRKRLEGMTRLAADRRMQPLDSSMRTWAATSPVAADAVAAADATLLDFVTTALRELGHDRDEARVRALMLLAIGTTTLHPPWRLPAGSPGRVLDIVIGD